MSGYKSWGRIAEVRIGDPLTWEGRTFLTLDMDWAHDAVMRDTHNILVEAAVPSTWFVTHDSPFLDELRADPSVELGIHPNFNKLLVGDYSNGRTVQEVIQRLLAVVPEAKSVRAHSLMQSSRILNAYLEAGLTHDATHLVEPSATQLLRPWRLWNSLVRVPIGWEDDFSYAQNPVTPSLNHFWESDTYGMQQFNFHPIHVFLNTDSLNHYERTRPVHYRPEKLSMERRPGAGVRSLLLTLLQRKVQRSNNVRDGFALEEKTTTEK